MGELWYESVSIVQRSPWELVSSRPLLDGERYSIAGGLDSDFIHRQSPTPAYSGPI